MPFRSVLFTDATPDVDDGAADPEFFRDLNLDQIVDALTPGDDAYRLRSFFCSPLNDLDAIAYRHGVFLDLEDRSVKKVVAGFTEGKVIERFTSQLRAMRDDDMGYAHYHR